MLLIISIITITIVVVYFLKKIFIKTLQHKYERSLINGDRKRCEQLGKIYYLSLDDDKRKAKGIVDIERKISDDFRSFNSNSF